MPSVTRYRYLFEQLVRRELRQRYQGSILGVFWYLVNPLVLMGAYWLMFGRLFHVVSEEDFPLFLMVGMIVWMFFSQSLTAASTAFLDYGSLIGKVRFPRETIPASVVTVQLVTFAVLLALLTPITVAIRGTLHPALLLLPGLVVCTFGLVLGASMIMAVLHAYYRDVQPILVAVLLPWFFLSPIFFRPGNLPGVGGNQWARVLLTWVNPIAPYISATREVLYDGVVPGRWTLLYVIVVALAALFFGRLVFRRYAGELAVVV